MAEVVVDSDELRAFALRLQTFSGLLRDTMAKTKGQMAQLGDSWQDSGYDDFQNAMGRSFPMLQTLADEADTTVAKLNLDADAIDEYAQLSPE